VTQIQITSLLQEDTSIKKDRIHKKMNQSGLQLVMYIMKSLYLYKESMSSKNVFFFPVVRQFEVVIKFKS
jgi:hypothetical protein